jgi:hypothetical protein
VADSAATKYGRPWRDVVVIILAVLGLAAASAFGATVTQAPTISGDPTPGSDLTASTGSWTPSGATPTYDWLRCGAGGDGCAPITGACGRRYEVRTADEGHTLRVRLTATESNGQATSSDSAPTKVVESRPYLPHVDGNDTCVRVTPTGPGQGTFTSGAQTGAGTTPAPATQLPFIDPFPVIRIAGRFKGKITKLRRVTVKAPAGVRIRVACKGRGCPYRRKAIAATLTRLKSLQRAYRPKTTIEIRVTQPEKIGKYTRVRTRRGKAPLRVDRCLMPGSTDPVRCPVG